jgi:cell division protein FtsL
MNGFAGFLGRSLRGVRLVEFGALLVLLVMATGVYLAKAAAGRERADITQVQTQIDEEQKRLRLLQAEVAHLEEPARLARLSAQIGLGPTVTKRQGSADELDQIAHDAQLPEKAGKAGATVAAQATRAGAPQ